MPQLAYVHGNVIVIVYDNNIILPYIPAASMPLPRTSPRDLHHSMHPSHHSRAPPFYNQNNNIIIITANCLGLKVSSYCSD